jgi:predicted O-methyltransferase YrrM
VEPKGISQEEILMHASSLMNMQRCYEHYARRHDWRGHDTIEVLDIGGSNVNGSYADIFSGPQFRYRAADIDAAAGVEITLEDPYSLPLEDDSINIVISGQAFEHVEFFWALFAEMTRVLAPDGLLFLIAPSAGPIHRYPVDCYRFYPDAYRALAKWAHVHLVEVWHDDLGPWNDLVGVFSKQPLDQHGRAATNMQNDWPLNRFETEVVPTIGFTAGAGGKFGRVKGGVAALTRRIFNAVGGQSHVGVRADASTDELAPEAEQGCVPTLEVLERVHATRNPAFYLETGVRHGSSLALSNCPAAGIDVAPEIQVDLSDHHQVFKMTSDAFFESEARRVLAGHTIDFALIDGMHLFEFALRDFMNIERYSSPGTVVAIDDVLPNHPRQAARARETRVWAGDVWKLVYCLQEERPELHLQLVDSSPTGLLIVTNLDARSRVLRDKYNPLVRRWKGEGFSGDYAACTLQRRTALNPDHQVLWDHIAALENPRTCQPGLHREAR